MQADNPNPPSAPPLPHNPPPPMPAINNSSPSPSKRQRVDSANANNNNNNNDNSTTTTNINNNNQGTDGDDQGSRGDQGTSVDYSNYHSVEVNLFGAYCSTCVNKPLFTTRGSNLWVPTHYLLRQHWKANLCFVFDTPNALKTERDLETQQIQLHNQLQQSTQQQVDTLIAAEFPALSQCLSGKFFYCINCGFFQKRRKDMNCHFGELKRRTNQMNCNASQHLREGGDILLGVHGMKCPRAIVELVRQKKFRLPYPHATAIVNDRTLTQTQAQTAARTPTSRRYEAALQQHYSEFSLFWLSFQMFIHISSQLHVLTSNLPTF